jgi:hypothetical protein
VPITDTYGQGISLPVLTDAPNAQLLGSAISGLGAVVPQLVMRFASATARAATITSPAAGMVTWVADVGRLEYHDGTAWQSLEAPHVEMRNASVSVNSSPTVYTALNLGSVITSNRADMFNGATPTRLIAPTAGTYAVNGYMLWESSLGTADGRGEFRLNSTGVAAPLARFGMVRGSGGNGAGVASGVLVFSAPGYAEVYGNQNSGSAVNISFAVGMHRISTST